LVVDKDSLDGKWMYEVCLLKAIGVEPGPTEAQKIFEDADKKRSSEAKFSLTTMMDNGREKVQCYKDLSDKNF
jgi:hypothetical protein